MPIQMKGIGVAINDRLKRASFKNQEKMDNTSLEIKLKSLDLEQNPIFKKKDHIKYIQDWLGFI